MASDGWTEVGSFWPKEVERLTDEIDSLRKIREVCERMLEERAAKIEGLEDLLQEAKTERDALLVTLKQVLRQWKMYAEEHEDFNAETELSAEGQLYRKCLAVAEGANGQLTQTGPQVACCVCGKGPVVRIIPPICAEHDTTDR